MANEATVYSGLRILKRSGTINQVNYRSGETSHSEDVTGAKGPVPGAIDATVEGVNVDLSELDTPGLCRIHNQDDTNYITWGIWDPEISKFYPVGEVGPGDSYVFRLARDIQEEYQTGTGTTGADTNRLRVKADTATCSVLVEAFED